MSRYKFISFGFKQQWVIFNSFLLLLVSRDSVKVILMLK